MPKLLSIPSNSAQQGVLEAEWPREAFCYHQVYDAASSNTEPDAILWHQLLMETCLEELRAHQNFPRVLPLHCAKKTPKLLETF